MAKIKLIQENPVVGDISGNLLMAKKEVEKAEENGLELIIFSEMFLSGYPPEDLVLRSDFMEKIEASIDELSNLTSNISIIIGAPSKKDKEIFNSAYFLEKNEIKDIYSNKSCLITKNSMKEDILLAGKKIKLSNLMELNTVYLFVKIYGLKSMFQT